MTNITVFSADGKYDRILATNHAGFADEGEDIVCAGISTLITTFENSLEQLTDVKYMVRSVEDGEPVIDIIIEDPNDLSQFLFESLLIGLNLIKEEYNDYISLDYKEV